VLREALEKIKCQCQSTHTAFAIGIHRIARDALAGGCGEDERRKRFWVDMDKADWGSERETCVPNCCPTCPKCGGMMQGLSIEWDGVREEVEAMGCMDCPYIEPKRSVKETHCDEEYRCAGDPDMIFGEMCEHCGTRHLTGNPCKRSDTESCLREDDDA